MKCKLVKNLGITFLSFVFIPVLVRAGTAGDFKVYKVKKGTLGISKASGRKIDFFYKRSGLEFRQFNNQRSTISFLSILNNGKSLTLGAVEEHLSKAKAYALFSGKEIVRNASNTDICNTKDFSDQFLKKTEEISKILSSYETDKFDAYFEPKSCSSIEDKGKVVRLIKSSIERKNDDFKACLYDNKTVSKKLEDDIDFRRLMFTYFVNLSDFFEGFVKDEKNFQISCEDKPGISKINPGTKPFKISFSKDLMNGLNVGSGRKEFSNRFDMLLIHELEHVFNKIPPVSNPEKCEHDYQVFISRECESGFVNEFSGSEKTNIPKCEPFPKVIDETAVQSGNQERQATAEVRGTGASGSEALGQARPSDPSKEPAVIAAQIDQTNGASSGTSGQALPQVRQQLSSSEETVVRRTADSLFGPAQSGNSDIETYANQIFASSNTAKQQQAAEQIAARLDARLDNFSRGAVALQGALGSTAVAATLPAVAGGGLNTTVSRTIATTTGSGNQTASANQSGGANWNPQQALNAYVTGNPGQADTSTTSTKLASKISNSGGVSAMANSGGSVRATTAGIPTNGGAVSAKMGVNNAVSLPGEIVATAEVPTVQGARMNYELDGQTSDVRDTPTLRMLSSSATNISGNLYKAITKDYKSESFIRGLKDRQILIRVLDPKTGKIQTTYGLQSSPEGQVRQPSSIGSEAKTKKQSHPAIIFEDNGTSLRKKDN